MKIALFGGSFDPFHTEHLRLVRAAREALGLDRVFVIPSFVAPHKRWGAVASGKERLEMCKIALADEKYAEASDFELTSGGTSYTYLTCRAFRARYPDAALYFLLGADMLENFFRWKNPEGILDTVTLVACGRGAAEVEPLREKFRSRFQKDFIALPFTGREVSSRQIRVDIAFRKPAALPPAVAEYIAERGLYRYPAIPAALSLEKEERREHSYRVAKLAVARARSANISEKKALLAAALHDCGKYVDAGSPLLAGFRFPRGVSAYEVPPPVVHQYTGAFLAQHCFGVRDREILDAIRYHASGREDMTPLGKLIYLADLLEEGRSFEGLEELRALFWRDLDECLLAALRHQLDYLKRGKMPVYGLTERAYLWLKRN